jgi:hypothetical protein
MQDDLGVCFGKPETYRCFVLPEPPKTKNIRIIHGCRFRILYPNHHAVYLSQHRSNLSNPLRSYRGSRGPPLFPQNGHGNRISVPSLHPHCLPGAMSKKTTGSTEGCPWRRAAQPTPSRTRGRAELPGGGRSGLLGPSPPARSLRAAGEAADLRTHHDGAIPPVRDGRPMLAPMRSSCSPRGACFSTRCNLPRTRVNTGKMHGRSAEHALRVKC